MTLNFHIRLADEKRDLDTKIDELTGFTFSDSCRQLPEDDKFLLSIQLDLMRIYSKILPKRLTRLSAKEN